MKVRRVVGDANLKGYILSMRVFVGYQFLLVWKSAAK
jgi:hypothetical protein